MKTAYKVSIVIALSAILLGGLLIVSSFYIAGFQWNTLFAEEERFLSMYTFEPNQIKAIDISALSDDVVIKKGSGSSAEIRCWDSESNRYEVSLEKETGILKIQRKSHLNFHFFSFYSSPHHEIEILLPENITLTSLKVYSASGDIFMHEIYASEIDASTLSGDLIAEKSGCYTVSLSTTSGEIELSDWKAEKNISASSTSGSIHSSFLRADSINASNTSGDIFLSQTEAENEIQLKTVSGKIQLEKCNSGGDISLSTISGNISGTLIGQYGDYDFSFSSVSGHIQAPMCDTGKKKCRISTTSGNASLSYAE